MITGYQYFAEAMKAHAVSHLFFVPTIMVPAMAAMEDSGITRITCHDEKAAAYMADGYARASGKPGICLAQNVGSMNLAAGLRDGQILTGQISVTNNDPQLAALFGIRDNAGERQVQFFPRGQPVQVWQYQIGDCSAGR